MNPKKRKFAEISNRPGEFLFQCEGCGYCHKIDKRWEFNGNLENPTIHPSLKVTCFYGENHEKRICHSFIKNGRIQYLNDCTHKLAGQTIEIPFWEDEDDA